MVKRVKLTNPEKTCKTVGKDLRTHFKNMFHVGRAIKGMLLNKAIAYLHEVLEHKKCIPFSRYDHSVGRTGQALMFGLTKGRWPEKSVKICLGLLQNAKSNAEVRKLDIEKLAIKNVCVNRAMKGRRRTYRAHGSINAYLSSNCHIEIQCQEIKEKVPKEQKKEETKENKKMKVRTARMLTRKCLAKAMMKKKYVPVGKKKQN